jgi:hypothetical protein
LELQEATFDGSNWTIGSAFSIDLTTAVSFGDNTVNMDYSSDGIELGKMYIGRVVAKNNNGKEYDSACYWVITNSLANDYYFQHPTDSMIPGDAELNVPITVTWKDTLVNSDVFSSIIVDEESLQTAENAKFEYLINPSTILEHKYEAGIAYDIDNFPIKLEYFVDSSIKECGDNTYAVSNYYAVSENKKNLDLGIENGKETIIGSQLPNVANASYYYVNVISEFDTETNITRFEATTPA